MATLTVKEYRDLLDCNGTIELKFKISEFDEPNTNISIHLFHDFKSLKTCIHSLSFIHLKYWITILNISTVDFKPNRTTFRVNVTILNKSRKTYTAALVESALFEIKLMQKSVPSEDAQHFEYEFVVRFLRDNTLCKLMRLKPNATWNVPVDLLKNQQVIEYVFKSVLLEQYGIEFPVDITALLFDHYVFEEGLVSDERNEDKLIGTMTMKEVMERVPSHYDNEKYLTKDAFVEVFGMERKEFYALKPWQRKQLKSIKRMIRRETSSNAL